MYYARLAVFPLSVVHRRQGQKMVVRRWGTQCILEYSRKQGSGAC